MPAERTRQFWRGLIKVADPKIWIASFVPMAVGGAIAYAQSGSFSWYWFMIGLVAVCFLETGKNALNEYADYLSGVDRFVAPHNQTPFSGGKKTITGGLLTLKDNLWIGLTAIFIGCLLGLYIALTREFSVIWFGLAGVFLAIFYSLAPFRLAYRGFGELAVGFTFGPLITTGTYLVQTGSISLLVLLASLPLGLIITNVLWINQYPDFEADLKGGKMNRLVRMGKKRGLNVYAVLFILAYLFLLALAIFSKNILWLLPFVSMPPAIRAVLVARKHCDNTPLLMEANIKTIHVYQLTGLLMVAAALLTSVFKPL